EAGPEDVSFQTMKQCLIIYMRQELDHHSVAALREQADKRMDRENMKHIIFDFAGVNFMDSSGIGMIMGRYKKVNFTGGKVAVTSVNPSVDRIFRLSGIYKMIEKYNTVKEALEAL
ncbi:MAG: anti-sigma F factor antagonist, partial [Acetivibrio sp.]